MLEEPVSDKGTNTDKLHVLLVENDEISKEVTEIFLEEFCVIDIVDNGEDALKALQQNKYDAFIMDINLGKGLSGLDVTRELRKKEGYENTPVIAVTAYAMKGDKEEFLEAGCSHYLSKPYEKETLIKIFQDTFPEVFSSK